MPKGIPFSGINKGWFGKGCKPSNTGKKGWTNPGSFKNGHKSLLTDKSIEKIRKARLGQKLSLKTKKKIGESRLRRKEQLGYLNSPETREKIKEATRGKYGKLSSHWQGGITALNFQIRNSLKYRQWRSDIFTRDNFTCQNCGLEHCKIEAHHLKEFNIILKENNIKTLAEALSCEELWNINNGITLCKGCHNETGYGRKKNQII